MNKTNIGAAEFIGYEYKEVLADREQQSFYLDCYRNFGWIVDENGVILTGEAQNNIRLKRNRKIMNKAELTRLQRNFEACSKEIKMLEQSRTSEATIWAIVTGIVGTAFMAGSTFAVTQEPPLILLCILLAIPGFVGWVLPYFLYQKVLCKKTELITPLIEEKYDEIYQLCEKGNQLLMN